jgi:hypothetical protein
MVEFNCESYNKKNPDKMFISSEEIVKAPAYNNFIYFGNKLDDKEELIRILTCYKTNISNHVKLNGFSLKENSNQIKLTNNTSFEAKKSFDRISNSRTNTENDTTVNSMCLIESGKIENRNKKPFYFVPCINCSNLIHIYDIGKYVLIKNITRIFVQE